MDLLFDTSRGLRPIRDFSSIQNAAVARTRTLHTVLGFRAGSLDDRLSSRN